MLRRTIAAYIDNAGYVVSHARGEICRCLPTPIRIHAIPAKSVQRRAAESALLNVAAASEKFDLGQVELRKQICPKSASFIMVS